MYILCVYLSTFPLFLLPRFNCKFIFFKLVAPVGVNLLIVRSLVGSRAAMGVHSNVITGDQLTIVNTVIATRVLLTDADHHQTCIC